MRPGCTERRATNAAGRIGALARGVVGPGLLAGLAAIVAGCGAGKVAAPVQSPVESVLPGPERDHVVGRGDTLYSIAWRYGIDYRTLARANSIGDPYTIFPGQRLLVPGPDDVVDPEPDDVVDPGPDDIVDPEPAAAAAPEAVGAQETSVRGTGTDEGPAVAPLPPLPSVTETETAPTPAASPPPAARTVAGVRWMRPAGGKTISTFGRGGNNGIDIGGTFEQPIRAAAPGRVVYAGSGLIGYGKLVIVKHDSRLLSAYAHNERLHVGEGDDVKGGQHIADMGRSARGRVMLHFEIRRDGKPVDPLRYLP